MSTWLKRSLIAALMLAAMLAVGCKKSKPEDEAATNTNPTAGQPDERGVSAGAPESGSEEMPPPPGWTPGAEGGGGGGGGE